MKWPEVLLIPPGGGGKESWGERECAAAELEKIPEGERRAAGNGLGGGGGGEIPLSPGDRLRSSRCFPSLLHAPLVTERRPKEEEAFLNEFSPPF